MKVAASVKKMCRKCKIIKRHGVVRVLVPPIPVLRRTPLLDGLEETGAVHEFLQHPCGVPANTNSSSMHLHDALMSDLLAQG